MTNMKLQKRCRLVQFPFPLLPLAGNCGPQPDPVEPKCKDNYRPQLPAARGEDEIDAFGRHGGHDVEAVAVVDDIEGGRRSLLVVMVKLFHVVFPLRFGFQHGNRSTGRISRAVKRSDGQHGRWRGQAVDRTARPVRISCWLKPTAKGMVEQPGHGKT